MIREVKIYVCCDICDEALVFAPNRAEGIGDAKCFDDALHAVTNANDVAIYDEVHAVPAEVKAATGWQHLCSDCYDDPDTDDTFAKYLPGYAAEREAERAKPPTLAPAPASGDTPQAA